MTMFIRGVPPSITELFSGLTIVIIGGVTSGAFVLNVFSVLVAVSLAVFDSITK